MNNINQEFDNEGEKIMTVFCIKGFNDETDCFDCGIASTKEKADAMIAILEKEFKDAFEYKAIEQTTNRLCINNKNIDF